MAEHICPWWLGYLLASPLRRLSQNPYKILAPYIKPGMTVLDAGCGMGFFSLDMAKLAGNDGKVICVDLQEKMIASLVKRASKAKLRERIKPRLCSKESLDLEDLKDGIDFALAFAIVHEVPDAEMFFKEIYAAMKPNGMVLFSEPKGHVSEKKFQKTVNIAKNIGFKPFETLNINRSRTLLFKKQR